MATDPFGKNTFGGATKLAGQIPGGTSGTPTAATSVAPWKSYGEYWKGNPEALENSIYHSSSLPSGGEPTDPYRFAEEYNQYKTTLPQQYQDLIKSGITPGMVQSGMVKNVMGEGGAIEPIQMPGGGVYGAGSGSTNSLAADILSKMWKG